MKAQDGTIVAENDHERRMLGLLCTAYDQRDDDMAVNIILNDGNDVNVSGLPKHFRARIFGVDDTGVTGLALRVGRGMVQFHIRYDDLEDVTWAGVFPQGA